jgi:hypothetical protein
MNVDRLFLDTLDDLEARTKADASEYDLLRAAGLLRELFLDESRLVDQVNRTPRVGLRFRIRVRARNPAHGFEIWLGIDPSAQVDDPIRELDLKELLRVPLVFLPSSTITVRQIITLAANVRGGVHRGTPRDPAHKAFERFRLKIRHGDMPLELLLVAAVAKVALAGLEPLRSVVRDRAPQRTARVPAVAPVTVEDIG